MNDALNAEMAQCNEIDNRIIRQKLSETEKALNKAREKELDLWQKIYELENRIAWLESLIIDNNAEQK